jgi:hypothetical protein
MKTIFHCVLLSLLLFASLDARKVILDLPENELPGEKSNEPKDFPWFTGPLLAPSGHVVPQGSVNYEPYFYWSKTPRKYDNHWHSRSLPHTFSNLLIQPTFQIGILPATEFDLAPQYNYNNYRGVHDWTVGDIPIELAFQIVKHPPGSWIPAIKLRLSSNLPIGNYQRLSPDKMGTDVGGSGNWNPGVGLVATRIIQLSGIHYLAWRFFMTYNIGTPVHVHGLNTYGGTPTTHGTVYPGNIFLTVFSMEYTLTTNWVFAIDFQYQHNNKTRFSGKSGGTALKTPSSELVAIAPAIEYNWSANVGVIFGPYFPITGRNTGDFFQWIFAINIYH